MHGHDNVQRAKHNGAHSRHIGRAKFLESKALFTAEALHHHLCKPDLLELGRIQGTWIGISCVNCTRIECFNTVDLTLTAESNLVRWASCGDRTLKLYIPHTYPQDLKRKKKPIRIARYGIVGKWQL